MASVPIIVEDTVNQSLREVEEHLEELHEATHEADEFIDIRTSKSAIQANLNLCSVKTVSIDSSGGGIERDSSGWAGEGVRPRSSRRRTRLSRKKIAQSRKTDLNEPEQVALFSKLVRIEENLSLEDLRQLKTRWEESDGTLSARRFYEVFAELHHDDSDALADSVTALFRKMDADHDQGVNWDEFTTHVMLGLREKEELKAERSAPLKVRYDSHQTRNTDVMVRIQPLNAPIRIFTVTESAEAVIYDSKLSPTTNLHLFPKGATQRVTDGYLLANASRIILATTARRFEFYHASNGRHTNTLMLPNVATCLDYYINPLNSSESDLVFGDMQGNVGHIRFSAARCSLFQSAVPDAAMDALPNGRTWLGDLPPPDRHAMEPAPATCEVFSAHQLCPTTDEVLDESVSTIRYAPSVETVISCAGTPGTALCITNLSAGISRGDVRMAAIPRACNHFDYSDERKLILSGGDDAVLRMWNPLIMPNPLALLRGHTDPIARVQINPAEEQAISVSRSEVVKIWDLEERVCLNTLVDISAPSMFTPRRPVTAIMWHRGSQAVLMAFTKEISVLQIQRDEVTKAAAVAHDHPVSAAAYLFEHDIVATGDVRGNIITWRLGTGSRLRELKNAHFNAKVTRMESMYDGLRLLSGSSTGEIVMWDVELCEPLVRLVTDAICPVHSLLSLDSGTYTVGADGKLMRFISDQYYASKPGMEPGPLADASPDSRFNPLKSHKTDVTASTSCGDTLFATGDLDGCIIVWHLKFGVNLREFSSIGFRTSWIHRSDIIKEKAPRDLFPELTHNANKRVDAMLWLADRVKLASEGEHKHCATLVAASDSGCVAFWSAIDGEMMGSFIAMHAPVSKDHVSAMAVSQRNTKLYTGDNRGHLKVWDITRFCIDGFDSERPKLLQRWGAHKEPILDVRYMEQRGVLLTTSKDCSVRLWNVRGDDKAGDYIGAFSSRTPGWSLAAYRIAQSLAAGANQKKPGNATSRWISAEKRVLKMKQAARRNTKDACNAVAEELHLLAEHAHVHDTRSNSGPTPSTTSMAAIVTQVSSLQSDTDSTPAGGSPKQSAAADNLVDGSGGSRASGGPGSPTAGPATATSLKASKTRALSGQTVTPPKSRVPRGGASGSVSPASPKSSVVGGSPVAARRRAGAADERDVRPKQKDWMLERSLGRVYYTGMYDRCEQKAVQRKQGFKLSTVQDGVVPRLPNLVRPFSALSLRQSDLAPLTDVPVPATVQDAINLKAGKRRTGISVVDSRARASAWK